ncbi:MAG TPA: biotin--protein ligase [Thermomicrobiales bacterium]|nr:biotin--protein ligase [Thermomicrobiales bacterium]
MHGEYKTPGGKLVVADFDVRDDAFRDVVVSGDFFLYPEEALDAIVGAIDGLPVTSGESAIARAVEAAIPDETEMLGFSPEAVAIALRRGLG